MVPITTILIMLVVLLLLGALECSDLARVGITTTMPFRTRPNSARGGGKSTWDIGSFAYWPCWASRGR